MKKSVKSVKRQEVKVAKIVKSGIFLSKSQSKLLSHLLSIGMKIAVKMGVLDLNIVDFL